MLQCSSTPKRKPESTQSNLTFSLNPIYQCPMIAHISDLFSNSNGSCVGLIDGCFHWLEKYSTNQSLVVGIKNGDVIYIASYIATSINNRKMKSSVDEMQLL